MQPFVESVYSRANCLHPQAFFVRLDSRCNQKCGFCNILGPDVEFGLKTGYVTAMLRQIASLRRDATVNFTGGEPTLRSDLPKLVRYGKQLGIERMVLQTNAIRLAQEDYLGALMEAGLDDILVSFHSSREEVSDSMTAAPGTWRKTVAGIPKCTESRPASDPECGVHNGKPGPCRGNGFLGAREFEGDTWGHSFATSASWEPSAQYGTSSLLLSPGKAHSRMCEASQRRGCKYVPQLL